MTIRLLMIAIAPGLALALGIYLTDRYDREPIPLLIKVFCFGALSVIPVAFVERVLMSFNLFGGILGAAFTAFVVAGFTEEFFKRKAVLYTAFYHRAFDEKLDGIVYAVFSALGFATVENISYVVYRFAANPYVGLYRGVLSVPAHMLFGITMGYYLSLSKFATTEGEKSFYFQMSLLMPVLLHGIFDFILMANIPMYLFLLIPFVIYLWVASLKRLNQYEKESKRDYQAFRDDPDEF